MICYVDMDGVKSNFVKGVLDKFGIKEDPYEKEENLGEWYIQKLIGISDKKFYGNLDYLFWAGLEKTKEADEIFHVAQYFFGIRNIRILTTPCGSEDCYAGKFRWIHDYYPSLRRQIITSSFKEENARPDRLLIDDSDKNVDAFRLAGGQAILFPRAWNSLHQYRHEPLTYFYKELDNVINSKT